jgi:hypothetical protein
MTQVPFDTTTVYVHLLDEGVTVIRPTQAVPLGGEAYKLLATPDYDPADEHWEFVPGSVVRCAEEKWEAGSVLVAKELIAEIQ